MTHLHGGHTFSPETLGQLVGQVGKHQEGGREQGDKLGVITAFARILLPFQPLLKQNVSVLVSGIFIRRRQMDLLFPEYTQSNPLSQMPIDTTCIPLLICKKYIYIYI